MFQLPYFDGYPLKKLLIIVLPIANTQEEAGVLLKLHPTADTFPGIGENVLILIFATQLKVKEIISRKKVQLNKTIQGKQNTKKCFLFARPSPR